MATTHVCPVCGYDGLYDPPRLADGGASNEICRCCGFEFGVSDDDQGYTYHSWRLEWIAKGCPWWSRHRRPPADWDPHAQLLSVTQADTREG
jgi:hypothetical protein